MYKRQGFLLCAMISPISNLDFHFPDLEVSDSSQAQSFSVHFEQQVVDAARDNVEGLVGQKLREAQIPYKKVEAVMDTSSSDSIGISKLIVTTDNPEDKIRICLLYTSRAEGQVFLSCRRRCD